MQADGGGRRALLLLLDGCRPDALLLADAPHLKGLALQQGAFSFHTHCGTVPLSAPSWLTILTGVPPEQHPVVSNDLDVLTLDASGRPLAVPPAACACTPPTKGFCGNFRRGRGQSQAEPLPASVFGRLAGEGLRSALFTIGSWEGVGRLCGAPAGAREAVLEGGRLSLRHFHAADLVQERQATEEGVAAAAALLGQDSCPDVVAIYLHLIDGSGHKHGFGADVPEYMAAIKAVDGQVGQLLLALEARRAGEDWLVAVTTDHGGTSRGHMPPGLRRSFDSCGCVQRGISQTRMKGVHGLPDMPQHTQTFQVFGLGSSVRAGEILPPPRPEDFAPTLLAHLLGDGAAAASRGLRGEPRGLHPAVPGSEEGDVEPPVRGQAV